MEPDAEVSEQDGPRDHDAVNHEDVGTWDRAKGVEALERLTTLTLTQAELKRMKEPEQRLRAVRMATLLASQFSANLTDASSVMCAYASDPDLDAPGIVAAAENTKAFLDLHERQVRWDLSLIHI